MTENAGIILSTVMVFTLIAAVVIGSYKSGFVAYSGRSLSGSKTRFTIDKTKIGTFMLACLIAIVINGAIGFAVTEGNVAAGIYFGFINTIAFSYALAFWFLLKKKKSA